MDVTFAGVLFVKDTADPDAITDEISSPTDPAAAASFVVVPIIPDVELNPKLVALAAPNMGPIKVGPDDPTKFPVPVCPDRVVFTALIVVIFNPYTIVKPDD